MPSVENISNERYFAFGIRALQLGLQLLFPWPSLVPL